MSHCLILCTIVSREHTTKVYEVDKINIFVSKSMPLKDSNWHVYHNLELLGISKLCKFIPLDMDIFTEYIYMLEKFSMQQYI